MEILETIIIAIVEGLTEFLPVSSTGHIIIAQDLIGVESTPFVKAFTVIIQFGAILSVVVLYWKQFFKSWNLYRKLIIAFIPAAIFGLLLSDFIDSLLDSVITVGIMLIIGGVVMIFIDNLLSKGTEDYPEKISDKKALKIGLFQCIAMIPGVSRSMATIVGGISQGLTRKCAAEFSFFLAVPTMFAAMCYKMLQLFLEPNGVDLITNNLSILIIGNLVSFFVALLSIKFFIGFVTKFGFKLFGYYRVVIGSIILILYFIGFIA
ncbi:MAG: undecaprenyl-diphosphate phosphatase [Rikenellaceae bacterium]